MNFCEHSHLRPSTIERHFMNVHKDSRSLKTTLRIFMDSSFTKRFLLANFHEINVSKRKLMGISCCKP